MSKTIVDGSLTPQGVSQIRSWLENARTAMPFLVSLLPSERQHLAKMGVKRRSFVEKTQSLADDFPQVFTGMLPEEQFRAKHQLMRDLEAIRDHLFVLTSAVDDTYLALRADNWNNSRDFYSLLEMAARNGIPAAPQAHRELKEMWKLIHRRKRGPAPEAEETGEGFAPDEDGA